MTRRMTCGITHQVAIYFKGEVFFSLDHSWELNGLQVQLANDKFKMVWNKFDKYTLLCLT